MDLISRQAAIATAHLPRVDDAGYEIVRLDDILKLPSAQPEIIRCKDCKWYKTNYSWNGKEHKVCVIEPYEPIREGDDFCSRAERKE